MVGHLFVGHVSCLLTRHVALATIRLIGVVLAYECGRSMAGETTASEVAYPLLRWRRAVRIVTSGASEPVPALPFALALQQSFPLARRPARRTQLASVDKVSYIIRKIVAREEIG